MLTYRVKRETLKLPEIGAPVHPDTYVRVIRNKDVVILENASLDDIAIAKDGDGRSIRRTWVLLNVRPDPSDKSYVFCDVDEVLVPVPNQA